MDRETVETRLRADGYADIRVSETARNHRPGRSAVRAVPATAGVNSPSRTRTRTS